MSATSTAVRGRLAAEREMTSACTIFTPGEPVTDPVTGQVTPSQTTVWFGPCRVRPADASSSPLTVGGAEAFRFDYLVSIPFSVDEVLEHHHLTVTASPDPALVGVTVEVQKVFRGDNLTARRLACTEVV